MTEIRTGSCLVRSLAGGMQSVANPGHASPSAPYGSDDPPDSFSERIKHKLFPSREKTATPDRDLSSCHHPCMRYTFFSTSPRQICRRPVRTRSPASEDRQSPSPAVIVQPLFSFPLPFHDNSTPQSSSHQTQPPPCCEAPCVELALGCSMPQNPPQPRASRLSRRGSLSESLRLPVAPWP